MVRDLFLSLSLDFILMQYRKDIVNQRVCFSITIDFFLQVQTIKLVFARNSNKSNIKAGFPVFQ